MHSDFELLGFVVGMYRALQVKTEFMGLTQELVGFWACHDVTIAAITIAARKATRGTRGTKVKTVLTVSTTTRGPSVIDSSGNAKCRHRSQLKAPVRAVEMLQES